MRPIDEGRDPEPALADQREAADAFMAAMLRDCGRLVLATELPGRTIEAYELAAAEGLDLAEIAITSGLSLHRAAAPEGAFRLDEVPEVGVTVGLAEGEKCARCWRILPEVGRNAQAPETCERCADAVAHLGVAAQ